jgi:uncharacterized protein (TIGR02302 family)
MQPHPPPAEPDNELERRLGRRLRLARAALAWERAWPLILPPLALAGSFVAIALFDILPILPGWLHALLLSLWAGGLAFLVARVPVRLRLPSGDEAARRLERDSELAHRPLAALADRLAGSGGDPLALALWQAHRRRMAGLLGGLRVALPHPNMAARDPWGWRAAVLLLLVIAATGGWPDARHRVARAITPDIGAPGFTPDALEIWITPPAYTGLPPVLLKPGSAGAEPVVVPAGSTVLGILAGGWGAATLLIDDRDIGFDRHGDGGQRVETRLVAGRQLAVRQAGRQVAAWPIQVAADALPSIAFALPPEPGERGRLRLSAAASDDYGLVKVWVELRRLGLPDTDPLLNGDSDPLLVVELPLPGGRPRSAELASWHDLTAHPWSGLPVALRPVAEDGAGQTGAGELVAITLPERDFHHPIARALIEQRRLLTESRTAARNTVALLDRIAAEPAAFNGDMIAFLAMRLARHALTNGDFDLAEAQDLLWNTALRIEEGDLSSAERTLEEARRALEKAIEDGTSADQLAQLLDQFQAAMERYLDALAQRMAEQGRPLPQPMATDRVVSDEELANMLDGMRDMAQTGARDALRDMLKNLAQMLDGLQAAPPQPADGPAVEGLQQLRDLARRQQDLLDRSHRRAQGEAGKDAARKQGAPAQEAQAQETLRRALGEAAGKLGEGLGDMPAPLGDADRAMAEAAGQLGQGQWGNAAEAQAEALRQLGQAAREAMAQMAAGGNPGMVGAMPRDPLGRPSSGSGLADDGTTRIPERGDLQKAREILDELRRRAGESRRSEPERDYLRRLLKQF